MKADTADSGDATDAGDGPPVNRLFGGGILAGSVVALAAFLADVPLTFAVGTGLFVAVLVAAGGLAVLGR
ncbi:hypothetical protein [Salinigranum sp. GCM10025319]|uniref:hypothetical protein n=1 Tax=Salinigranum sp. GCM10025319 TaxID=3252687 RepID=UPI003624650A